MASRVQPHSNLAVKPSMDIKNALNAVIPLHLRSKDNVEKAIKPDSATDRDANGQMPSNEGEKEHHEPMSDEQLEKALERLRSLGIVKENQLEVELTESEGKRFVLIKDPAGKVIRRIHEAELWTLKSFEPHEKGQLLRKTA